MDTCHSCDNFEDKLNSETRISVKRTIEQQKKPHLTVVENVRSEFKELIDDAKQSEGKTLVFIMDLQRTLETPLLATNKAFYKRQLWVYNFCMHNQCNNIAYMYVWHEGIASRGAPEISSCIIRHIGEFVPEETENINFLSESCSGQNRNIKLAAMLKWILVNSKLPRLKSIEQRYYVSIIAVIAVSA